MLKKLLFTLAGYALLSMIVGSWMQLFDKWPWNRASEDIIWWWLFHLILLIISVISSIANNEAR